MIPCLLQELVAGALYRALDGAGLLSQQCYTVNRGEGLAAVQSCEGLKVRAIMGKYGTYFGG